MLASACSGKPHTQLLVLPRSGNPGTWADGASPFQHPCQAANGCGINNPCFGAKASEVSIFGPCRPPQPPIYGSEVQLSFLGRFQYGLTAGFFSSCVNTCLVDLSTNLLVGLLELSMKPVS
jgi:hypothetical protein